MSCEQTSHGYSSRSIHSILVPNDLPYSPLAFDWLRTAANQDYLKTAFDLCTSRDVREYGHFFKTCSLLTSIHYNRGGIIRSVESASATRSAGSRIFAARYMHSGPVWLRGKSTAHIPLTPSPRIVGAT